MNYDPDMPAFLRRDWPEDQPKETDVAEPRNEPMTEVDDTAELAARIARTSASGDLRDLMLDEIKQHQARPWNERPEQDQHAIVNRVEAIAEAAVSRIVHLVAGDGRRTIAGMLEQFTTKDGIKATITFSSDDNTLLALNHARGATILVVVADAAPYIGERQPAPIVPDQSTLLDEETPVRAARKRKARSADAPSVSPEEAAALAEIEAGGIAGAIGTKAPSYDTAH